MAGHVHRVGWIGAIVLCAAACGSSDPPAEGATVSTAAVWTTRATTTTSMPVDDTPVQDCVDYVQFGAYTGNQLLLTMWNEAGRSTDTLRTNCETLARDDPATFEGMSAQWRDIQSFIAVAEGAPSTTPPITPATMATPATTMTPETTMMPETTMTPETTATTATTAT